MQWTNLIHSDPEKAEAPISELKTYLPAFEAGVRQGNASGLMCAYPAYQMREADPATSG